MMVFLAKYRVLGGMLMCTVLNIAPAYAKLTTIDYTGDGQAKLQVNFSGAAYSADFAAKGSLGLHLTSKGAISKSGVVPSEYVFQQDKKDPIPAWFDMANQRYRERDNNWKRAPAGVQDALSVWLQLGFLMQQQEYRAGQTFELPMMIKNFKSRTIKVINPHASLEGQAGEFVQIEVAGNNDIWLSRSHQFLPAQIRVDAGLTSYTFTWKKPPQ